jgi:hypothetical protein
MKKAFIGFDPGADGFITTWTLESGYKFYSMPTELEETGTILKNGKAQTKAVFSYSGLIGLASIIREDLIDYRIIAAMEQVGGRGGWSATNNFNFGYKAGCQRMVLELLRAEIIFVRPQKWQSFVRKGYELIKNPSSSGKTLVVDAKAMAEFIVDEEFPQIDFRKTERAKKQHDGKIDSFLICNYLIRTYKDK